MADSGSADRGSNPLIPYRDMALIGLIDGMDASRRTRKAFVLCTLIHHKGIAVLSAIMQNRLILHDYKSQLGIFIWICTSY